MQTHLEPPGGGWIGADDPPATGETVLVYCRKWAEPIWLAFFDQRESRWRPADVPAGTFIADPTHWRPLPEEPER